MSMLKTRLVVLAAAWFSLRLALTGFVIGALLGLGLAMVMARFRMVERGLLPYLVMSQTVPLIALAPLVATWGGKLQIGEWVWPRWMSAAVLGAFLAFFPVAVGSLRGFASAPVKPSAAFYSKDLREFILPYDAVRDAESPDETLLDFLQATYEAAANLANWNREFLERKA